MKLTHTQIKNAKSKDKQYKLTDGQGMYLLVKKTGSKLWRYDYRINGRRKTCAIGIYPEITLKKAREALAEAREMVANGIDPSLRRKLQKASSIENNFEAVAREWYCDQELIWSKGHSRTVLGRLENHVFPWIGVLLVNEITVPELLVVLQRVKKRGTLETAHRIRIIFGQIFRYAISTGRAEYDLSVNLKDALPPTKPKHHASIVEPQKIASLLRVIDVYKGNFATICALKLAPHLFVRPGELRQAEWSEFDMDAKEWRIPADRMKKETMHIVPLSKQVISILEEQLLLTGRGRFVFPGVRSVARPMSENTVNGALRRLGYTSDEMTGHGFRSMASTRLNEMGWDHDAVERQLAHLEKNKVKAAYNYAEYLDERRKMMQVWSDYLDQLKTGDNVVLLETQEVKMAS